MVLARIGAILSVCILDRGSSSFKGSVLVTMTSLRGESSIFLYASPENSPWVAAALTSTAPCSTRRLAALTRVPPVATTSSIITTRLPSTFPMTCVTSECPGLSRILFTMAQGSLRCPASCLDLDLAGVRGDHDGILRVQEALVHEIVDERVHRRQVNHGEREVALDLARVQVHRHHPFGPRGLDHISYEARGYGFTRLGLAVLARVSVPWDNGHDPFGRGPFCSVYHDEQLHQVLVDRVAQ